ncbi:hypothetical protein RA086_10155 [Lactiplantibacillus sp. WILCCON 0030]|uniref:Cell surface protein n=1 Tax=Lactiplantibacillus brownii TaxID=3069269 RepID=A0ABU1AAG8_9LACO|nr:hypothetical protein [Lactiplantibacillus brownii]MDQ7937971.1 hypothetical protein [Lactiplantibacillus brownii]
MKNQFKWWGLILVLILGVVTQTQVSQAAVNQTHIGVTVAAPDINAEQLQESNHQIPSGDQIQSAADTVMPRLATATKSPVSLPQAVQKAAASLQHGRLPQTAEASTGLIVIFGGLLLMCWLLLALIIWQKRQLREGREIS